MRETRHEDTDIIPVVRAEPRYREQATGWPTADPDQLAPGRFAPGQVAPDDAPTTVLPTVADEMAGEGRGWNTETSSVGRSTGSMAVAGLCSKVTGFVRTLVIVWVLGFSASADAFNAANSMPNQVYELLVGGVLTSVMVPLLVRARVDDADGGESYTQRLLTMTASILVVVTLIGVVCAPLLTDIMVDDSTGRANPALATEFAYLLLPQILFYGLSALFSAILNARNVFGPPAWGPVLNNVILIGTFATYLIGILHLDPSRMQAGDVLYLGIGSTLAVVAEAAIMVPALLRSRFRFRWRWGWDPRFSEFGGLALWTVGYALLAQVGVVAVTNVTTSHGGLTLYNNVWQLVQLPYGVIGFALITAILPRMSRAAAEEDIAGVKRDFSLAARLSVTAMVPMSALLGVLGPSLGVALFSHGKGASNAQSLGAALATAAFGVLPYAITLIQLRVFYALKDARTPTLIMLVMVSVKVALTYLTPLVLPSADVVYGVLFANSLSFVVGWVVGELWLRRRIGPLRSGVSVTLGKTLLAAAAAGGTAELVRSTMPNGVAGAWLSLVGGGLAGVVVTFVVLTLLRSAEMQPMSQRLASVVRR